MLLSLVSCTGSAAITDDEAKGILEELLPKAEQINDIIWGQGLPVEPGQDGILNTVTAAQYRTVAKDSPYQSTEELKAAIAEVYSDAYIKSSIDYICFEGAGAELESAETDLYPRYKDNDDGVLIVDITNKGFELTTEYDISSVKVVSASGKKQTLEVDSNIGKVKLVIVDQNGEWRFDGPAY